MSELLSGFCRRCINPNVPVSLAGYFTPRYWTHVADDLLVQALAFRQAPRHRQDQRHGHVGRVLGQDTWRVGDRDAPLAGGGQVDIVDTVAIIGDQF